MRILVFTSLFPNHLSPDFGVFIKNRILNVARLKGCEIIVIAPVPYCPKLKFLGKWYEFSKIKNFEIIEGINVYHPRYILFPKISMVFHGLSMFTACIHLVGKLHRKNAFNLIDAHYVYPDGFAAVALGRVFNLPVVVSARGSDINFFPKFKVIKRFIQRTLSSADAVISVCNALKDTMISLGCAREKITVIPNGIDVDRFYIMSRQKARVELGVNPNQKIILSVGGLIERKGHHFTIEALRATVQSISQAHLYIAGQGEEEEMLKRQVLKSGMEGRVTFLGHVSHQTLLKWYNSADVFCLASSREGWANVIMESLACGTPVVATQVFGAPEILTNEKLGILVNQSVDSISAGLITALGREWDRREIRMHVENRSWNVVANEVEEVFKKILGIRVIRAFTKWH